MYKEHKKQQQQLLLQKEQQQQQQQQQHKHNYYHKMNIVENHHQGSLITTTSTESDNMDKNKKIHFMKISSNTSSPTQAAFMGSPQRKKLDWDPHMTMTSPVEWETSPLVSQASSGPDDDSGPSSPLLEHEQGSSKHQHQPHKPDIVLQWEDKQHLPDVISNNEATSPHSSQQSNTMHQDQPSLRKPSIQHCRQQYHHQPGESTPK